MTTLQAQARALGDPTRHAIFRYVADAGAPVGVAELTAHLALNHNAIRQHLAKLLDAGLVVEATVTGGGRGRPKLVYELDPAVDSRWGVPGPYERLSVLLAEVISTGDSPVEVGRRAGRGRAGAAPSRSSSPSSASPLAPPLPLSPDDAVAGVAIAMARGGFEPDVRRRGNRVDIILRNCPFETTALAHPDTVCSLHLGLAEGAVEGSEGVVVDELVAKDPRRAGCRLRLRIQPAV